MDEKFVTDKLLGQTIVYVKYCPLTEQGFEHLTLILDNGASIAIAVDPNSTKSNLAIL